VENRRVVEGNEKKKRKRCEKGVWGMKRGKTKNKIK
jgi:hypothetical protein